MVCKKCKNQIPDGSEFCGYCGHRAAKKKEEKGKSKTPFLIGLAIGLIVALILTVVLVITRPVVSYDEQIEKGYDLLEEGKHEEAVEVFDEAIKTDEKRPEGYMGKAQAMAHDPNMTMEKAKAIADVLEEGYIKTGSEKIILHVEVVQDIMEGGFIDEAKVLDSVKMLDKEQGWMDEDEYKTLISTFLETPYFGLDDDYHIYYDEYESGSIWRLSYADFKETFGDEILYEGAVEDGLSTFFEVVTKDATYCFMNYGPGYEPNKDNFLLGSIDTKSEKFTFGRGIKVGMEISELERLLPTTEIPNGYSGSYRYLFGEDLEPCETIPAGGTLIYRSTEIWNDLELIVGWERSEYCATMYITQKNGVITEINSGTW